MHTRDTADAVRAFLDAPVNQSLTLQRIDRIRNPNGTLRDEITTPGKVTRTPEGELVKEISTEDPTINVVYVELQKGQLRLDGVEVDRIAFRKHAFTEADFALNNKVRIGEVFATDIEFTLKDGSTRDYKHISPDQLEAAIGRDNVAHIEIRAGKTGTLKGHELTPHEGTSPELQAQAQHVMRDFADYEKPAPLFENTIERDDILDHETVVARAAAIRAHDRNLRAQAEGIGNEAEARHFTLDHTTALAERQVETGHDARMLHEKNAPHDFGAELSEADTASQTQALARVLADFRVNGRDFYFRDFAQQDHLAFCDRGTKIITSSNDERVARGMANMAEAHGWKAIKVNGHQDFRRQVWMEASIKGIAVRGFTPTEQDKAVLRARQEPTMRNSIQKTPAQAARQRIAGNVAEQVLASKIKNGDVRGRALEQIHQGLETRAATGHAPGIPVWDKGAPQRTQQQQREKGVKQKERGQELAR